MSSAVAISDETTRRSDIWIYDAERGTKNRLTIDGRLVSTWTPFSLREGLQRATGLPWVPPLPEGDLPGTFAALREQPILLLGDADPEISDAQAKSFLSGNIHPASSVEVFANTAHGVFSDQNREEYRGRAAKFLAAAVKAH